MLRLALATMTVAAAAAVAFLVPAWGSGPVLVGEVGPGFTVEVKRAGHDLKTIKAGTYRIKVEDKASIHNFHLFGPGPIPRTAVGFVNRKTGVASTGDVIWTIKLRPGRYTYQCDPHHLSGMRGHFTVTK
jgi:plastocyanin